MAILYDRHPTFDWSPDGRFIAYTVSDVNQSQVYVASTDGSGSTPVGDPALKGASPAWSPDGSLIAFAAGATDSERGLYLMRPDGTPVRRLTKRRRGYAGGFAATWSPDGRRLAFTGGGGWSSMWLVDVDGKNEQQVDDGDHLSAPAWAPDGKRLAWLHPVPDLSQPAEYRVADANGRRCKKIPQPAAPRQELTWDTGAPYVELVGRWEVRDRGLVARRIQHRPPDRVRSGQRRDAHHRRARPSGLEPAAPGSVA